MKLKCVVVSTLNGLVRVLLPVLLAGCNSSLSDPFAAPSYPIGQKFFVPPDPINKVSLSLNSETLVTRATVLKLSRISELLSSRSDLSAVGDGGEVELKSIAVVGKEGFKRELSIEKIKKTNESSECAAISIELKDLLVLNKGMTLICDEEFTRAFRVASRVIVRTKDDQESVFTSWGSQWVDLSGYRVVFQAINL